MHLCHIFAQLVRTIKLNVIIYRHSVTELRRFCSEQFSWTLSNVLSLDETKMLNKKKIPSFLRSHHFSIKWHIFQLFILTLKKCKCQFLRISILCWHTKKASKYQLSFRSSDRKIRLERCAYMVLLLLHRCCSRRRRLCCRCYVERHSWCFAKSITYNSESQSVLQSIDHPYPGSMAGMKKRRWKWRAKSR